MSDGKKLTGVEFDRTRGITIPYVEQELDYDIRVTPRVTGAEGNVVDQVPTDRGAAKIRTYDLVAIQAELSAITYSRALTLQRLDLPPELLSITVVENSGIATGASNHPTANQAFAFTAGSGGLNPRASAESSASASYEIIPTWRPVRYGNGPAISYGFYVIGIGALAESTVIAALASKFSVTATGWPKFLPQKFSLVLKGQQASVRSAADTSTTVALDSSGTVRLAAAEWGDEYSKRLDINNRVIELPECLCGSISISPNTVTKTATVTVAASTIAITYSVGPTTIIPAITNAPGARTQDAVAAITPTSIGPTTPATIPSTGKFIYDYNYSDAGFGMTEVSVVVVDISDYV